MKIKVLFAALAAVLFLTIGSAYAEEQSSGDADVAPTVSAPAEHKAVKGDNLWKLSRKYHTTVKAILNLNPYLAKRDPKGRKLKIGDKIQIPQVTLWMHPNAAPISKLEEKDESPLAFKVALLNGLNAPEPVKKAWAKLLEEENFDDYELKNGDLFQQIYFVENNKPALKDFTQVAWVKEANRHARVYRTEFEGKIWALVLPEVCHNIGYWLEKPRKAAKVSPPPPPKEEVVAAVEKKAPVCGNSLLEEGEECDDGNLLSGDGCSSDCMLEKTGTPVSSTPESRCNPQAELTGYAGRYDAVEGDNYVNYFGIEGALFPCGYQPLGDGRYRVGPSFKYGGWDGGEQDDFVQFKGKERYFGGEFDYLEGNTKTAVIVRYGEKEGDVTVGDFYRSHDEAKMIAAKVNHQEWFLRELFPMISYGVQAEIDVGGEKSTVVNGQEVAEGRKNQSMYGIFGEAEIVRIKNELITPFVNGSVYYREENHNFYAEPAIGVKLLKDSVAARVSYQWVEGSHNDATGAHVVINIHNLIRYLAGEE